MVWGMSLPSGFGEFWPDGEFEFDAKTWEGGWSKRLKQFYQEQNSEQQKALFNYDDGLGNAALYYTGYVIGKFISEIGTCENAESPPFSPIKDHEPPRSFDVIRGRKSFASLIKLNDRILAVDAAVKGIIERLEPGVHQFFPIEIRLRNGTACLGPYYTLVIGQYFDSFAPERSKEGSCELEIVRYRYNRSKADINGLAFRKSVFGKKHLWRERQIIGLLTCFSDELQSEIANAGLRIPRHYRMKEV